MGAIADFRADLDRYVYMGTDSALTHLLTTQGVWALAQYRFNRWVFLQVEPGPLRSVLRRVGFVWYKIVQIVSGVDLPAEADIGRGFYIGHYGGIFIVHTLKMGENCNISQQVTIGSWMRGNRGGAPVIGDRVYIGPGAKIFGPITIGDDVAIGANAVVTKDVPSGATVAGVPAKVLNHKGSHGFIKYRGRPDLPEVPEAPVGASSASA